MEDAIPPIIAAAIGSVITWFLTKHSDANHKSKLSAATQRINDLTLQLNHTATRYEHVKRNLQASAVVKVYHQPVLLVGPRAVGKTSLLSQWHAPWDHSRLNPTMTHSTSTVPIYDFKLSNTEPHFADSDILTDVHIHLKLKIHDFPGEVGAQEKVVATATQETKSLRESTGASLGIVLICMFNAEEAATQLSQSTIDYYNGELFSRLRSLVAFKDVRIERLLLVFNKRDLLERALGITDDVELLNRCLDVHKPLISLLHGACNHERVCEVFTVLSRENLVSDNRGAPIVMGEAARAFVTTLAGGEAACEVVRESASNLSAPMFE